MTSVELYHFIYEKNSDDPSAPPDWGWYYTSSEDAFYYAGQLVQAVPISRTEIETKSNVQRESLEVSMSLDTDIAIQFVRYSPDHLVHLTLYDYEESGATKVKWKGRLAATKIGSSAITLVFESVYVSIRSTMMTQKYQRGCRHMLYSDNCTMKRENWQIAVKIMSVNGYDLVMDNNPSATDGYFTGGVLEKATGTTAPTHICSAYYVAPSTGMKKIPAVPANAGQLYKTTFAADASAVTEGSKVTIHTDAAQVTATTTSGVATIVKKYGTGASGTACLVKF